MSDKIITDISCGTSHCIALSSVSGKVFSWGTNRYGELGIGSQEQSPNPCEMPVPRNEKFVQIACGNGFSIGIGFPLQTSEPASISWGSLSTITRVNDTLDNLSLNHSFVPTPAIQDPLFATNTQQVRFTFSTSDRLMIMCFVCYNTITMLPNRVMISVSINEESPRGFFYN